MSPPMTPDFKPEDADTFVESVNAKWRIKARTAHTAMISGMKSLSESHEQIVVAWTGEVLVQTQSTPSPLPRSNMPLSNLLPAQSSESSGDATPSAAALSPKMKEERVLMVYGGEFDEMEKMELGNELDRFTEAETEAEKGGRLKYVPVFLPSNVSKGHYEGFCKKSEFILPIMLTMSSVAAFPLPSLARLDGYCPLAGPTMVSLSQRKYPLCGKSC